MRGPEETKFPVVRRLGAVPALDGLRGVAVLLVILSHMVVLIPDPLAGVHVDEFVEGGLLGVDVFFVLSGFLITALLLDEQAERDRVRLGSFYARRALRLLPALYVFLVVQWLYSTLVGYPASDRLLPIQPGSELTSIKWALVYATNWQLVYRLFTVAEGFGHLWSLAIEEQFYLVWPILLILFFNLRRSARFATAVLVTAIVLVALHRYDLWRDGVNPLFLYVRTDTRIDSLLIGALLASLWVRRRTPTVGLAPAAWVATIVLAAFLLSVRLESGVLYAGGFTVFGLAVAVLILATIESQWAGNRVLSIAPLRLTGRVSYGLYLWHLPIFFVVAREGEDWSSAARIVVALGLTACFTAASWQLVERPALRLKRRFSRTAVSDRG